MHYRNNPERPALRLIMNSPNLRPSRPREDADIFSRLSGAGFSAADRVVVDGQYLLTDGAKISSGNP